GGPRRTPGSFARASTADAISNCSIKRQVPAIIRHAGVDGRNDRFIGTPSPRHRVVRVISGEMPGSVSAVANIPPEFGKARNSAAIFDASLMRASTASLIATEPYARNYAVDRSANPLSRGKLGVSLEKSRGVGYPVDRVKK